MYIYMYVYIYMYRERAPPDDVAMGKVSLCPPWRQRKGKYPPWRQLEGKSHICKSTSIRSYCECNRM